MSIPALGLIREKGVYGLGGYDGCDCTHFSVQGVSVDISCRKGSNMDSVFRDFFGIGIRIRGDMSPTAAVEVANEVTSQLADRGYAMMVRFCDWQDDKECRCVYCRKPRENAEDYLCPAHKADPAVASSYAYPRIVIPYVDREDA